MSALPRVECPVCRKSVPVRRNGALREHHRKGQQAGIKGVVKLCPGSGQIALFVEAPKPVAEVPGYLSCRVTTSLSVTICSIKHHDRDRALSHARKIRRGMGERALMVEVVGRVFGPTETGRDR